MTELTELIRTERLALLRLLGRDPVPRWRP